MAKETEDQLRSRRLQQLMDEVDGPARVKKQSRAHAADQQVTRILSGLIRWTVFGLFCLGLGFWAGAQNAELRWASRQPSEKQLLTAQGWQKDGTGVFYRWCQDQCHAPQMYGGGVIKAFDVKCVERPCGEILMRFNVLNSKGAVIDQILLRKDGIQGETRRFLIESQNPDAASLELVDFSARAKV